MTDIIRINDLIEQNKDIKDAFEAFMQDVPFVAYNRGSSTKLADCFPGNTLALQVTSMAKKLSVLDMSTEGAVKYLLWVLAMNHFVSKMEKALGGIEFSEFAVDAAGPKYYAAWLWFKNGKAAWSITLWHKSKFGRRIQIMIELPKSTVESASSMDLLSQPLEVSYQLISGGHVKAGINTTQKINDFNYKTMEAIISDLSVQI